MPSKKQRRRREKSRRHEYEYVLLDEDGNEVPVDPTELKQKEAPAKAARATRPSRGREVQPPSWQRVAKRGLLFAPVMFVMVTIISGNKVTMAGKVTQTLMLLAFFLPFSYLMDTFAYRTYRKRADRSSSSTT
jgi:cation transport ATPase